MNARMKSTERKPGRPAAARSGSPRTQVPRGGTSDARTAKPGSMWVSRFDSTPDGWALCESL